MNEWVTSLGCENTHFVNCDGLHDENQYTTASDMAKITLEALKSDLFVKISAAENYTYDGVNFIHTNLMLHPSYLTYYYEYAQGEKGLVSAYSSKDAVVSYINGYVEMVLQAGMLYTTGPQQEAFIAYKRSDEKVGLKAGKKLIKGMFAGSSFGEVVRMLGILGSGGSSSIEKKLKKKKQKYLFVGLVCVREEYQGQGYMLSLIHI